MAFEEGVDGVEEVDTVSVVLFFDGERVGGGNQEGADNAIEFGQEGFDGGGGDLPFVFAVGVFFATNQIFDLFVV